jgi:hypothetical protein
MEASDWIAIAALGASVIISIAGFWFNYKTNKENIRARRADLVTEKSIDAYREIVGMLEAVSIHAYRHEYEEARAALEKVDKSYRSNRVYFSEEIASKISSEISGWAMLIVNESVFSYFEQERIREGIQSSQEKLFRHIQKLIGLEMNQSYEREDLTAP